jgi:hypothetical protein
MAAGLGFKTFTTGEVLTAADTNGYLMQGVLVFASAAARNAAITSPQEGQFAYTKDTNGLWYYDGAAWVASGATGDIEGVTAGVGISGGGTSGTVTITNSMATEITAAGDIIVGTGSGTFDNLPIGTTAQVLTADTTVSPYKVKWATPAAASSGLTLVSSTSISGATSSSFNSVFTSTYANYRIVISALGGTGTGTSEMSMRFRASGTDTSANYSSQRLYGISTTAGAERDTFGSDEIWYGSSNPSGPSLSSATMEIFNPQAAVATLFLINSAGRDASGPTVNIVNGSNSATTQFDGFTLISNNGNISATVRIYGYQNS